MSELKEAPAAWEMDENITPNQRIFLTSLEKCLGVVADASRLCGFTRKSHYEWMRDNPSYVDYVQELSENSIDFVESKLFESIRGIKVAKQEKSRDDNGKSITQEVVYDVPPNVTAMIFYLKTRGKHRGYIERNEVTGKEGQPILGAAMAPVVINITDPDPDKR